MLNTVFGKPVKMKHKKPKKKSPIPISKPEPKTVVSVSSDGLASSLGGASTAGVVSFQGEKRHRTRC